MSHYWLLLTITWLGSASLQYINTGGPGADTVLDPLDPTLRYPLPYTNFFNLPNAGGEFQPYQNEAPNTDYNQFYPRGNTEPTSDLLRKRRKAEDTKFEIQDRHWLPNLIDTDKTLYLQNDEKVVGSPFIVQGFSGTVETNATDLDIINPMLKKSFSPWGGKRDKPSIEHMWTWKRATNIREPSMPKRVRFSPWGGKRSGQLIYKPGAKGSKIIFSSSGPDMTRIVSKYSPNGERLDLAGFHFIPSLDKRHPIRILALRTQLDDRPIREALPFNAFLESLPNSYKPGHPYADVNLKKDGKRKVKFSAWGGKRSPPIIGPIWTPSSQNVKDTTLDAILLIRNSQDTDHKTTKAL